MSKKPIVLVVDDEPAIRDSIKMLLKDNYQLYFADCGKKAISLVNKHPIDLVLLDVRMPEIDGLEVLEQIKRINENIEVIMLTAVITVNTAVKAMKKGAYDYITKPFDIEALQELIANALEKKKLEQENTYLRSEIDKKYTFEKIIGQSRKIKDIFELIDQVAKSASTVLVTGESGTGKELVARAIHTRSKRKEKLFVAVNCAAIPENLLESELFGHERGSFTGAFEQHIGKFEIADSGTLFLDEISLMPKPLQSKLLRVLQEKEIERIGSSTSIPVDVRVIAATNQDLKKMASEGDFREDLFYRLNVVPIFVPPLRDRKEDIPLLVKHFLEKFNLEFSKKIKGFKKEAEDLLLEYNWPGNVRELENLIERLVVLGRESFISDKSLPPEITRDEEASGKIKLVSLREASKRFEASFIKNAIAKSGGSKAKAAKLLGIHRNTLLKMEKKLGDFLH